MSGGSRGSSSAPCSLTLFGYDHHDYAGCGVGIAIDRKVTCMVKQSDGFKVNDETLDSNKHPLIRAALIHGWSDIDTPISFSIEMPDNSDKAIRTGCEPAYIASSLGALAMVNDHLIFEDIAARSFEVIKASNSMLGPLKMSASINGSGIMTTSDRKGSLWSYGAGKKERYVHHLELPDMDIVLATPIETNSAPSSNISLKVEKFITRQRWFVKDIFRDSAKLAKDGVKAMKDGDLKAVGGVLNDTDKLTRTMGLYSDELKSLAEVCRRNSHGARLCVENKQGIIMCLTDDPDELCNRIADQGGISMKTRVSGDGLMA